MKTFACDAFFQKGTAHRVCQDYAFAGFRGNAPFIIVADGCSGAPDSDTGARILTHCALPFLDLIAGEDPGQVAALFGRRVIGEARRLLLPGLESSALDATLIVATALSDRFRVLAFGDGIICTENKAQNKVIEYSPSAPFYLNYLGDAGRLKAYRAAGPQVQINGGAATDPEKTILLFDFPFAQTDRIGIGSDGWMSLVNRQGATMELASFEEELLAFRTTSGAFVQRRVGNGLLRKLERQGFAPADDVSFAAIVRE